MRRNSKSCASASSAISALNLCRAVTLFYRKSCLHVKDHYILIGKIKIVNTITAAAIMQYFACSRRNGKLPRIYAQITKISPHICLKQ